MFHFPIPLRQLDDMRSVGLNHGKIHREATLTANPSASAFLLGHLFRVPINW